MPAFFDKLMGVIITSHLGKECHQKDQRKKEGPVFHG